MNLYVHIAAEVEVDDDILQNEYDNDSYAWAEDNLSFDFTNGLKSMDYWLDAVEDW